MKTIADKALEFAKKCCDGDSGGHDFGHIERVYTLAVRLAESEGADVEVCALAAALHDVDDRKLSPDTYGNKGNARRFALSAGLSEQMTERIVHIIEQVSFKGSSSVVPDSIEGMVVQDADRLDALGAVGIARCFAYGGSVGREIYTRGEKPRVGADERTYYASKTCSINHFYEKLLLLKDMMNTDSAKREAALRHDYTVGFLKEFFRETGESEL